MRGWLTLTLVVGLVPSLGTGAPELTADEVVERHLEAVGGREKIAEIKSLEKSGQYIYNGWEHPIISYHKIGRKVREEIEGLRIWATSVWEGHSVVRGTNGKTVWLKDESRDSDRLTIPPDRIPLILEEADLHGALFDYRSKGHKVELIGQGDVDGTPAHQLRVTLASGVVESWYLDLESFLVLRIEVETEEKERDLERPRAWQFDDYRPVNGVMLPFWVYVEESLFAREYIFETIRANVTIADGIFEPPPGATESRD